MTLKSGNVTVRKRSAPWIQRRSRPVMAGLAALGAVVTAYLTVIKLTGNEAGCPVKGCDVVLSSPYATVFGLPLALFGLLAYVSMMILAIAPLLPKDPILRSDLESWTGWFLFLGSTTMMVFSGYLMYLLAFEIKAVCVYCIASAILSTSLFVLAIIGRDWRDTGQLFVSGAIVGIIALVSTFGIYANINNPITSNAGIATKSGEAEIALAKHLNQTGAKFYGAFWCPHCKEQKQLFGKEAMQHVPYVECSPPDRQGQTPACQKEQITNYPTWVINGQRFTPTQTLEKLSQLSGYKGPRSFQNSL